RRPDGSRIAGWGTVSDPDRDCTILEEDGAVTVTIPGTRHGLNPTRDTLNAPRILRPIDGDFRAVVRVTGDFTPAGPSTRNKSLPYNGAGILLFMDASTLLWLARNQFNAGRNGASLCFPPLFELFENGKGLNTNPRSTSSSAFKSESTALYLERKG